MQEVDFLNPLLRSRELQRLAEHFHQHNALRLRSPARAVVWNTPRLARLRVLLHGALQPSPRVAMYTEHIIASMGKFAQSKGLTSATYVALQLPHGEPNPNPNRNPDPSPNPSPNPNPNPDPTPNPNPTPNQVRTGPSTAVGRRRASSKGG